MEEPKNNLFCSVCEVNITSGSLEAHTMGKKHARRVRLRAHDWVEDERTVYVRGFSLTTTTQTLTAHFSPYGRITKIHIMKEKSSQGMYAFVEFGTASEAQTALKPSGQHVLEGCHLIVRPKVARVLTVHATLAARRAADPPITMTSGINYDKVTEKLRVAESVSAQMTQLQELLRLTPGDTESRQEIVTKLEAIFKSRIPECRVRPFGSSVNGFGVRGCDMDIFLDLNLGSPVLDSPPSSKPVVLRIDDTGSKLIAGLQQATVMQRVNYVCKALCWSNLPFAKLMKIPASRCPVIQFVDAARGTQCDLSINNSLALKNTDLLQTMCRMEPHLQTLMYTLRHYFKSHEISGGASGGQKLTSYALCWLAITYLQQCVPPLLPSVDRLRELAGEAEQTTTDGWDTTFSRDPDVWRTNRYLNQPAVSAKTLTTNSPVDEHSQPAISSLGPTPPRSKSADELLVGFFAFYSALNLATLVVCPRLGKVLSVDEFLAMTASHPQQEDFKFNIVNIQDPFVLSHNLAQNLNDRMGERIADKLNEATSKCVCSQFLTPSTGHDWGVTFLVSKKCFAKPASNAEHMPWSDSSHGFDFCIDMEFRAANVPSVLFSQNHSMAEVKVCWVRDICTLLRRTFEEALLFTCSVTQDNLSGAETEEGAYEVIKKRASSNYCVDEPMEKKICTKSSRNGLAGSEAMCTAMQVGLTTLPSENPRCPGPKMNNCSVKPESGMSTKSDVEDQAVAESGNEMCSETTTIDEKAARGAATNNNMYYAESKQPSGNQTAKLGNVSANAAGDDAQIDTEGNIIAAAIKTMSGDSDSGSSGNEWPKERLTETLVLALSVETMKQTWAGRKRIKKEMRAAGEGVADTLHSEKVVVKKILAEQGGPSKPGMRPIMTFDVKVIKTTSSNGKLSVSIQMRPTLAPKMFNGFYQFFKPFLVKLKDISLFGVVK